MTESIDRRDFFISFNSADLAYAAAIDAALRAERFTTYFYPSDLPPGGNIPLWMDMALMNSAQTLALYSPDYVKDTAVYSRAEHYASWWQEPGGDARKLIPIVLRETPITPLIAVISRIEVKGTTPDEAATLVVKRLKTPKEIEERDHARVGLPLPKIFNAAYRPNPNFAGRFEAMESLQKALRAGNAAITAVAGMGGVGKTTLAAEYCHRFGGRYGGVWWIRAEQEPVMLADLQALGQRLGVVEGKNTEVDARATLDHLASLTEPWLLVYDNAPNPDTISKWLPAGAVRCLITSRFTEFGGVASVTRLDQWSDEVTAAYLLSRTGREDASGATRLARALGGLPLAAEQAAVFLGPSPEISFDDYAADITRLINEERPAGAKGQYEDTVYAAFVKSLGAISETNKGSAALDLIRLCAFLSPDGVELDLLTQAAEAKMLPDSLAAAMGEKFAKRNVLAALASLSLLRQEPGPFGPVLIFHRLLLDVARDWMGEHARTVWGDAAVQLINTAFPDGVAENPSRWPLCARLMPHVAPLESHAPRMGAAGRALDRLLNQACVYLSTRGDREGALALAEGSVALARLTRAVDPLGLATSLNNLGRQYTDLGQLEDAEGAYTETLEIADAHLPDGDSRLAIWTSNLAGVHVRRKDFVAAELLYLRAAAITKAAHGSESAEYGTRLGNLDSLYDEWAEYSGDLDKRRTAERYSTQALTVTRAALGERHPQMAARHYNLAVLKARLGDWNNATPGMERAVAIMLSLDLAQHPNMQSYGQSLMRSWEQTSQADKAARLWSGNPSDLLPVIAQIEAEHRTWVAADPGNRHFGPPSPFASFQGNFKHEASEQITAKPTDQSAATTPPAPTSRLKRFFARFLRFGRLAR